MSRLKSSLSVSAWVVRGANTSVARVKTERAFIQVSYCYGGAGNFRHGDAEPLVLRGARRLLLGAVNGGSGRGRVHLFAGEEGLQDLGVEQFVIADLEDIAV